MAVDGATAERRFAYHRSVAPMLWVLVALSSAELVIVHILVSVWSRPVAIMLSVVTALGVLWLIVAIAAMKRLPLIVDDRRVLMRAGFINSIEVDRAMIAGLRGSWSAATIKQRDVLNLALVAYPNVVIDLVDPLPGRRGIRAIAHRVDDLPAFARAIDALGGARD